MAEQTKRNAVGIEISIRRGEAVETLVLTGGNIEVAEIGTTLNTKTITVCGVTDKGSRVEASVLVGFAQHKNPPPV